MAADSTAKKTTARKAPAKRARKRSARKASPRKAAAKKAPAVEDTSTTSAADEAPAETSAAEKTAAKKTTAKKTTGKKTAQKAPRKRAARSTSAPRAEPPRSRDDDSSVPARPGGASRVAGAAMEAVLDLTGKRPEAVTGLERTDDGWTVEVDVLELERIPSTTDVLGTYQVMLDGDGELTGCRRVRRYLRGSSGDQ